ncbi:actin family [Parasitella parasitica]|nr:actin family [Parasitella parasitica]
MVAYGGDEVNALVFDMGSTMTRAGYAGEDTPRVMFPTSFGYVDIEEEVAAQPTEQTSREDTIMSEASDQPELTQQPQQPQQPQQQITTKTTRKYYVGDNKINTFKSNMQIKSPLKNGLVEDWDAMEHIWDATFNKMLRIEPRNHPLLCTEVAWNTPENRQKTMQLAFEKFDFPAFYLAPDAVMTAFSVGRATALVLDSGGGITSAVPVYDGFVLKKGILHQPLAGDSIVDKIKQQLEVDLNYTITPHYRIAKKKLVEKDQPPEIELRQLEGITNTFNDYQSNRVLNEFKETICQISDTAFEEEALSSRSKKTFEFPDGFNHSFGIERFKLPEMLFQPDVYDVESTKTEDKAEPEDHKDKSKEVEKDEPMQDDQEKTNKLVGVHDMVYNSINNCDIDLRPLLFNNVVVTGGNTLFRGFNERLNNDLPLKAPGSKIKIHAAGNTTERKCSSWLGGSILASLGTFHQLWISRKEYEEFGESIIHRRC